MNQVYSINNYKSRLHQLSEKAPTEAKPPTATETMVMKVLIVLGVVSAINFTLWFFDGNNVGYYPLFLLLSISISYKLLKVFFEWYHYWAMKVSHIPSSHKHWQVDMFTTAVPGEPFEMIKRSLVAMKKVRYPHKTFLCDEGNDARLRRLCEELDVIYVTRNTREDAKAGNINNALRIATGQICVILDPDHVPAPEFLDHVLPYFSSPKTGFVQIVQAYSNANDSLIARGAAQQTYAFYGPLMMGMNRYGTVQALGANCTFRRKALDSIGGHAPGLAEDMHTAMRLHAKGWKSVYVPKILARGLVPSTLPSYYKQQLKWSRGTFELLMTVFPKLLKDFTWRQKLHYLLLPLHFAFGLIVLLDITVPIVALTTGNSPVHTEFDELLQAAIPFGASVFFIRQYAQKWLLERHEIGLHIIGGAVLVGTWWVHLLGMIYTFLRINVPYIATPKDDKATNNWLLSLPNLVACFVSLGAISYGLYYDWNIYSLLMSGFALTNVLLLSVVVFSGQHVLIQKIKDTLLNRLKLTKVKEDFCRTRDIALHNIYGLIRNGALGFVVLTLALCYSIPLVDKSISENYLRSESSPSMDTGGFYTGAYIPIVQEEKSLDKLRKFESALSSKMDIVSIYQFWGPESLENFPARILNDIKSKGSIPMITWEPYVSSFPERADNPELRYEKKGMAAIASGKFDEYIKGYALKIRAYNGPVFIRFGHEADNPAYPWSATGENTPEEYKAAWRQVVAIFADLGVNNVTWVWTPWNYSTFEKYYPGDQFIDWIGLTCLNYGYASSDGKWKTFNEIYTPFREHVLRTGKPVMLAEFGSTSYGGNASQWFINSFKEIRKHNEIKSVVFFNSDDDKNWVTNWRPNSSTKAIDWTINPSVISEEYQPLSAKSPLWLASSSHNTEPVTSVEAYLKVNNSVRQITTAHNSGTSSFIEGKTGNFRLIVNGQPFYIKGIAYNAMHEWRDGYYPLTRRQLESDFDAIRAIGANTVRRYHPSPHDEKILDIAHKKNLKVLYGFWFDPKVNYHQDTAKVREYISFVERKILEYRDSPAVVAWSIGNETSGLLKKHYTQPYLTVVREAYMQMIEKLARRIHQLDPHRIVVTSLEHSWQLPGEIYTYNKLAPSVDVIGVNSYYDQQISNLQNIAEQFDPDRPYLVSEFGPSGYWNPEYSSFNQYDAIIEESDPAKADLYSKEWKEYIYKNKGYNIGGIAFSWRDRYEGTATWFGITDYKNRKKPAYNALQSEWTGKVIKHPLPKASIIGPSFTLLPNTDYKFKALYKSSKTLKIEWKLYKDNFHDEVGSIEQTNNPNEVIISLPKQVKNCRLYLYISDDQGNVTTASKPIRIYQY